MSGFPTSILDDSQASDLCSSDGLIVVNAELEPDNLDIVARECLVAVRITLRLHERRGHPELRSRDIGEWQE